jgi:hypothetical protein
VNFFLNREEDSAALTRSDQKKYIAADAQQCDNVESKLKLFWSSSLNCNRKGGDASHWLRQSKHGQLPRRYYVIRGGADNTGWPLH